MKPQDPQRNKRAEGKTRLSAAKLDALIEEALALGYDSVMIDASRLPLEENIRLTAEADAKGFFERLGMEKLEEYSDGNCSFGFPEEGMRRLVKKVRRIP